METLPTSDLDFLRQHLDEKQDPPIRLAAARAIAAAPLSDVQQLVLTDNVAKAGPLEIRTLLAAYRDVQDIEILRKLAAALGQAPGGSVLTFGEELALLGKLEREFKNRSSLSALDARKLVTLQNEMPDGKAQSGRQIFFSRKAACSACHRVGSDGGKIGPDLSKVGERRTPRDLLEAIVLPSNSIARGFESHAIRTQDGQTLTGLVVRETAESLFLRTLDQRELRVKRSDIDQLQSSPTSIMPAGLDAALSRQELADLVAYLQSLK
jgi:putative heme-binding domain-containing protein